MKISRVQQIPFTNYIRIHLKDKTRGNDTPMDKIVKMMYKNRSTYLIGKDIFILNSSDEIKEELRSAEINYEEIDER